MGTFALWLLMNASIAIDHSQTLDIASRRTQTYSYSNPDGSCGTVNGGRTVYRELNPIIGSHPSRGKVNMYFGAVYAVNNTVFFSLPKKYRPYYAVGVIVVEGFIDVRNQTIGIKMGL
jgi:hypothetical protein